MPQDTIPCQRLQAKNKARTHAGKPSVFALHHATLVDNASTSLNVVWSIHHLVVRRFSYPTVPHPCRLRTVETPSPAYAVAVVLYLQEVQPALLGGDGDGRRSCDGHKNTHIYVASNEHVLF